MHTCHDTDQDTTHDNNMHGTNGIEIKIRVQPISNLLMEAEPNGF